MILSNVAIHRALDDGDIVISPEPMPRFTSLNQPTCPYGTTAVDLRLASELSVAVPGAPITVDLRASGLAPFLARNSREETIPNSGYVLERNQFVLGRTEERVSLPIREGRPSAIAARVEGKSSRARCGLLVHFTAPTVHAGFDGTITLEIINLGPYPITLFPGVPICQLIFERVDDLPRAAPSQFQGQTRAVGLAQ